MQIDWKRGALLAVAAVAVAAAAYYAWGRFNSRGPGEGFIGSNGRIEATEIDIAAKTGGRLQDVLVREGDFVEKGQPLAHIQVDVLNAQRDEAKAQIAQAKTAVATAQAQVAARQSDRHSALAAIAQHEATLTAARAKFRRSSELAAQGMWPRQDLDNDLASMKSAEANTSAARAQAKAAQSAIDAARSQVAGAQAAVTAGEAALARIEAEIDDSTLRAPLAGRVQYRVANVGEVVPAGGKVLNLVDLSDVYMTFFLPAADAGRLAIGSEVRIVLDAAPQFVIPARISFVSATAQFTPKTVETASEREKLMFRVRAQIDRELLLKHLTQVKTGLPGMAWVRTDPTREWPASLTVKVQE
ncbi:MAG TPA: HlyD family efflux transporter periplasmic adaptor subunit [Burkholderiaceae bacterium]|nr:HlyD family efflux transporter periplasmic adaptor subunit [Burkholderiaceae bacterium]